MMRSVLPLHPSRNDASFALDLIRAVAAELVVFGHALGFFGQYQVLTYPHMPYMQDFAVLLFFLLSGFLIAHTLRKNLAEPGYSFTGYAIDRFARVYSGYLPALVLVAAFDFVVSRTTSEYALGEAFNIVTFVGNMFMLQDFPRGLLDKMIGFHLTSFGSARPFWTVAIEMWIYLFIGALCFFRVGGYSGRHLLLLFVFGLVPIANLFGGRGEGLFACWLLGALVEHILCHDYLRRFRARTLVTVMSVALAVYGLGIFVTGKEVFRPSSYVLLFIAFLALMALTLRTSVTTTRPWLPATIHYFAGFSFSLYLIHYTFLSSFVHLFQGDKQLGMWLAILFSNLVAAVFAHLTERRYKALGAALKRLIASPQAVAAATAAGKEIS